MPCGHTQHLSAYAPFAHTAFLPPAMYHAETFDRTSLLAHTRAAAFCEHDNSICIRASAILLKRIIILRHTIDVAHRQSIQATKDSR